MELSQYLRLPEKRKTRISKFFQKYIHRGKRSLIWGYQLTIMLWWCYFGRGKCYHIRYTDLPLKHNKENHALKFRIDNNLNIWAIASRTTQKFSASQNTRKISWSGHLENIMTLDIDLLSSIFVRMSTLKNMKDILYFFIRKNYIYSSEKKPVDTSGITFDGIISTAGDGRCRSLSETTGTQLVALLGTKPGKHWTSSDGAFIALPTNFNR